MNAKAMATEITTTLVAADPANALTYEANAKALDDKLDALDKEIAATVSTVKDKPFIRTPPRRCRHRGHQGEIGRAGPRSRHPARRPRSLLHPHARHRRQHEELPCQRMTGKSETIFDTDHAPLGMHGPGGRSAPILPPGCARKQ
jgi:hypothetical protein